MPTKNHNQPDYIALIEEGRARIDWVEQFSPVMNSLVANTIADGSLRGKRIAVVVHLEAKTAYLASVLADAGAEVVVAGSNPRTTNGSVVAALRDRGVTVVSEANGDMTSWETELLAAADFEPEYIIDDGAELTLRMAIHRPQLYAKLLGVSEETTTGTARLCALYAAGKLPFPALTANDARCKHLFDNRYGTGQTTLQAVLRLTNRQIGGVRLVVIGYGYVGRGICEYAAAMGARVGVVEVDPVRALEAHADGHDVATALELLADADIVITATGGMRAVAQPEFAVLRDNTVLANAGHHDLEIDVCLLSQIADSSATTKANVATYVIGDRRLHLLSGGALVNIAGGSGHPVEIMDLTFSVQGLGAHYLINQELEIGVHVLPKAVDDSIASAKLASLGIHLDEARAEQSDDISSWINKIPG